MGWRNVILYLLTCRVSGGKRYGLLRVIIKSRREPAVSAINVYRRSTRGGSTHAEEEQVENDRNGLTRYLHQKNTEDAYYSVNMNDDRRQIQLNAAYDI